MTEFPRCLIHKPRKNWNRRNAQVSCVLCLGSINYKRQIFAIRLQKHGFSSFWRSQTLVESVPRTADCATLDQSHREHTFRSRHKTHAFFKMKKKKTLSLSQSNKIAALDLWSLLTVLLFGNVKSTVIDILKGKYEDRKGIWTWIVIAKIQMNEYVKYSTTCSKASGREFSLHL